MSHQPNWQEYGQPVASSNGTKTVTEIHDGIYGTYNHPASYHEPPNSGSNPAEKLNPSPFTLK